MNLLEVFQNIALEDVNRFVAEKRQEDSSLEFKVANHPTTDEFDRRNFSQCLSGFANSGGGLIVWGIKASKDKNGVDAAKSKKPIKELDKFINKLKRWEGQAITPHVEGIGHRKVPLSKKTDEGYAITFVPKSEYAPHMANYHEKHYYKRSGDSFYICEHYDIMDMVSRKRSPKLRIHLTPFTFESCGILAQARYNLHTIISIENFGDTIAKYPYMSIQLSPPYTFDEYGLDGNRNRGLKIIPKQPDAYTRNYCGGTENVIYPKTIHQVDKIILKDFGLESGLLGLEIKYTLTAESMERIQGSHKVDGKDIQKELHSKFGIN